MKVSVLIPCYNEASRVSDVLKVVCQHPRVQEVVVVDDGSDDATWEVISSYPHPKVRAYRLTQNRGKWGALQEWVKHITTPQTLLLDADLKGLKKWHISKFILMYKKHYPCAVIARRENQLPRIFPELSGQRLVATDMLCKVLEHELSSGYGIEGYMNYYLLFNKIPVKKFLIQGVSNPIWEKKSLVYGIKQVTETTYRIYVEIYTNQFLQDLFVLTATKVLFPFLHKIYNWWNAFFISYHKTYIHIQMLCFRFLGKAINVIYKFGKRTLTFIFEINSSPKNYILVEHPETKQTIEKEHK